VNIETGLPSDGGSQETILEAFIDASTPAEKDGHDKEGPSSGAPLRGRDPTDPPAPSGY